MRGAALGTVLIGTLFAAACGGAPARPRESEVLARSRLLLERVSALEADLHSERNAIDTFALLEERHGLASEFACKVTDEHVSEMHRMLVAQQEKRREQLRKRRVTASVRAPIGAVSQR